jgi:hypothetical protein
MTRIKTLFARHGIAFLALFIALGGTATAATLINGKNIKKGTVTSKQVKDRSLLAKDFKAGQLPKGAKGDTGATGSTGAAGAAGASGAAAAKGDKGDTGAAGVKGDTGAAGVKGDTGADGAAGVKGDTGADGAAGVKGDTGADGSAAAVLQVVDGDDVALGTLVSFQRGTVTPADMSTNPPTPERRTPAFISYLTAASKLVTVNAATAEFDAYEERVIYYENYRAPRFSGDPAVCSGRAIIDVPHTSEQEAFQVGTNDPQLYSWSGAAFAMGTEGVSGSQGCEQLNFPQNSGNLVTQVATPANITAPVRITPRG